MENIQVAVRLRPLSHQESQSGEEGIWDIQSPNHIFLQPILHKDLIQAKRLLAGTKTSFTFDDCFGPTACNQYIYGQSVRSIVLGSLKGINGSIFVYGQTGSGKTYTMLGPHDQVGLQGLNQGILFQSLRELFSNIEQDLDKTYVLRCSYIEIYNEQIFDLLKSPSRLSELLTISEDSKKEFVIKGVIEESVQTVQDILDVLQRGEINRHYAQTAMNHHSSRSHAIFRLTVQSITNNFIRNYRRESLVKNLLVDLESELITEREDVIQEGALITESVLNFIDLAGSEKVSNHIMDEPFAVQVADSRFEQENGLNQRTKDRIKEGQYINKSLFFLTQVIFLRAEDKGHIPYRNSSLTKILRSSLGGNSRTLIILCINPTYSQFEFSLSTIRFGLNAKKIENKVRPNIRNNNDDEAIKIIIAEYEKRIRDLEKARNDDKENLEFLRVQLQQQSVVNQNLQKRLEVVNKQNFSNIGIGNYGKPGQRKLAKSVHELRQTEGVHMDSVGDIFHPIKTKVKVVDKKLNHDCQAKIVQAAFKVQKGRSMMLQQQIGILLDNYHKIKDDYLVLYEQQLQDKEQLQMVQQDYEHCVVNNQRLYFKAVELAKLLDLSELPSLNDGQMLELKQMYLKYANSIEQEQWRRNLMSKLGLNYSPNRSNEVISALYETFDDYEHHIQQVEDLGRNHLAEAQCPTPKNDVQAKYNKSQEIDQVFFRGFYEQWNSDQVISFEQMQIQMNQLKDDHTSNSSLNRSPSLKASTIKSLVQSPNNHPLNGTIISIEGIENDLLTVFQNIPQCQNIQEEQPDKHQRTFTETLMDFIAQVDQDKFNQDIKEDAPIIYDVSQLVDNTQQKLSSHSSIIAPRQAHQHPRILTDNNSQNHQHFIKRDYQTPENKQKHPQKKIQPSIQAMKASNTPTSIVKQSSKSNVKIKSIDRNGQNKNTALYATNIRRQAAGGDSGKITNTTNNSKQNLSNLKKVNDEIYSDLTKVSLIKPQINTTKNIITKIQGEIKLSKSKFSSNENLFVSQLLVQQEFDQHVSLMGDQVNSSGTKVQSQFLSNNSPKINNF